MTIEILFLNRIRVDWNRNGNLSLSGNLHYIDGILESFLTYHITLPLDKMNNYTLGD